MNKYLLTYFALLAIVAGAAIHMLADTGELSPMAPASPEGQPAGPPVVTSLPGLNASATVSPTASVASNGAVSYGGVMGPQVAYGSSTGTAGSARVLSATAGSAQGLTGTPKAFRHHKRFRASHESLSGTSGSFSSTSGTPASNAGVSAAWGLQSPQNLQSPQSPQSPVHSQR
jgi:hypothetical protein